MPWPTKKLGEVLDIYDNGIWGPEDLKNGVLVLRSTNFNNDGTINFEKVALRKINPEKLQRKEIEKEDILLERSGGGSQQPVGRVVYFNYNQKEKFYFGNFISRLRANRKEVQPKFLFLFLYSFHQKGLTNFLQKQTTGIRNLNFKRYLEIKVPLPPLKIQKQIVAMIEELFEKIDKAKELRQKAKEETEQILPAALGKIFKDAKKKHNRRKIEEILELNQSGVWGDRPDDSKNTYPVIRSTEITHEGRLSLDSVAFRKIDPKKVDKYSLNDGDILIVKSSGSANLIGRCAIFKSPPNESVYLFANFIQRFRPNRKFIEPKFLYYFLNSEGKKFVQYLMTTTTGLRNLPIKQYIKLEIPLPPLPEQKKIVAYLDNLREKVERLKQLQQKQLEELEELKKSILDKAFKGELFIG